MDPSGESSKGTQEADSQITVPDESFSASISSPLNPDDLELNLGTTATATVSDSHISTSSTAYESESQRSEITSQSEQSVVVTEKKQVIDGTSDESGNIQLGEGEISLPGLSFGASGRTVEQTSKTETTHHVSHKRSVEVSGGIGDIDLSQFGVGPDGISEESSTVSVIKEKHILEKDGKTTTEEQSEYLRVDEGTPAGGITEHFVTKKKKVPTATLR